MGTIMEDSDYSVSNTDAIICCSSDISGRTESLISDPNIPNSSSTSEDEYQQQQISTAAAAGGGDTDDLMIIVSSSGESSSSTNNNKQSEQKIRIFNVDFRKFSSSSSSSSSARQLHECSVCGLEFLTGQALGGHMRRHRAIITSEVIQVHPVVKQSNSRRVLSLDLNLTPSENDLDFFFRKHTPVVNLFL